MGALGRLDEGAAAERVLSPLVVQYREWIADRRQDYAAVVGRPLFECPLCGVADRNGRCSKRASRVRRSRPVPPCSARPDRHGTQMGLCGERRRLSI